MQRYAYAVKKIAASGHFVRCLSCRMRAGVFFQTGDYYLPVCRVSTSTLQCSRWVGTCIRYGMARVPADTVHLTRGGRSLCATALKRDWRVADKPSGWSHADAVTDKDQQITRAGLQREMSPQIGRTFCNYSSHFTTDKLIALLKWTAYYLRQCSVITLRNTRSLWLFILMCAVLNGTVSNS